MKKKDLNPQDLIYRNPHKKPLQSLNLEEVVLESARTEYSQTRRTLNMKNHSSRKGITLNCVSSRVIMGALYWPQKVEGRPSYMTPKKTTQSLENITLTSCLCQ